MVIDNVQKYFVGRKIAFPGGSLEDFPVGLMVEIIIEKFFFFQMFEDFVFPKNISP